MSGDSQVEGFFVVADYLVFASMLAVSLVIGVYIAWTSRGQESSRDFLTGGRKMTALPVALSLAASFMSSITVLSNPAEVYCFGAIFAYFSITYVLSVVVISETLLPVFYRLSITSSYEYLELRFNKATRLLGTLLFIVQTILFTGVVIYGPALALNQVTGLDLWSGIISTGTVCIVYCSLGGLKAVVWTDVFQIAIMMAGYLSVIIKAMIVQGGIRTVISDSQQGGRLNFQDFDINPLRRHTFWTITIGGTFAWITVLGANQCMIQRYFSCKSITHARGALYINMVSLCSFLLCSVFAGMCLYSVYKNCDPWTAGLISTPDQLMPYLMMDIMTGYPGLPGLFFAAVYSGSLSTVSSSINALAAVTVEDLIKPFTNMSDKRLTWISKGLSVLYGVLCISMAGFTSVLGGMMQTGSIIGGVTGGPLFGIFTLGILCPFANGKGALSGLVSGLVAAFCVGIGGIIYPPPPEMTRPLSLTTEGCNFTTPGSPNWTSTVLPTQPAFSTTAPLHNSKLAANWHTPSYVYYALIGIAPAIIVGLIVSLFTGGRREKVESRLMLMKQDTMSYHLFMFLKDKVMRTGKLDQTEKVGNTDPASCDHGMDIINSSRL